jgi:ATP-dependent helicase HrpA
MLGLWRRCREQASSPKSGNALRRFCKEHFLSYRRIKEWQDIHDQILTILAEQKFTARRGDHPARLSGEELYGAIHRSVLSGFLGNIAVKKEKNLYTATQGRQAMIFPGSGLFNRGGNWIVAAEMVETSRLFARTVANIDPGWREALGGHLCRSTFSNPRWEKDRGEVVATEQVSLFGLTIVPGRPVSFGRIDPAEATRIFVRDALVTGEVKRPLPFLSHNLALAEKIAAMEDKLRRHDLLAGEEQMARFYEERLPGIFDIRTLQRLVRDRGDDHFLDAGLEAGLRLPVRARQTPGRGHPEDSGPGRPVRFCRRTGLGASGTSEGKGFSPAPGPSEGVPQKAPAAQPDRRGHPAGDGPRGAAAYGPEPLYLQALRHRHPGEPLAPR